MYAKQALIGKMNFNWTDWYGVPICDNW